MKTSTRIIASIVVLGVIWGTYTILTQSVNPVVGTELAIANVNGGYTEWANMNLFEKSKNVMENLFYPRIFSILALLGIWAGAIKKLIKPVEE